MSLYRKYRPKTFSEVIDQEHVTTTLKNAVEQDNVAHAYLFSGPRGTGKTSIARILAKAMLTRGMEDATLKRKVEEAVDDGSLVDLVEIDAASNRGIDDIRNLVEKIQFSPVVAKAKVYIVDEVHMLTREAFNALLKTLEEPPPYAFFILATTELQKIPATIQSRCQRFPFRPIHDGDIVANLRRVATAEGITIDDEALAAIARHAQGGMRDALSLLDQLRSLPAVSLQTVKDKVGESGQEHVTALFQALFEKNARAVVEGVRTVEQTGMPLDVFARQLLQEARERLHAALEKGEESQKLVSLLTQLLTAIRDIRLSPVPGLALEAALLSFCRDAMTSSSLASTPKAVPAPPASTAPAPASPTPLPEKSVPKKKASPPADTQKSEPAVPSAPATVTLESIRKAWPQIVHSIPTPWLRMSLKNAHVRGLDKHTLLLGFASAFHRDKVAHLDAARQVEDILQRSLGAPLKLACHVDEGGSDVKEEGVVDLAEAAADVF